MHAALEEHEEGTAYHEAGHAVIGFLIGRPPLSTTIIPDGSGAVGKTEFENGCPESFKSAFNQSRKKQRRVEVMVVTQVAGCLAQSIKFPERPRDPGDDMDEHLARDLVMERSWQDIDIYLANARAQASALLNEHWPWVEAVAKALIERKTLTGDEVLALRP